MTEWLFRGQELAAYLERREARLREAIGRLTAEQMEEAGTAGRLVDEHRVVVPVLRAHAAAVVEHGEIETETRNPVLLGVRGLAYRTVIAVPFEGDAELFRVQPSAFGGVTPPAEIGAGELRIVCMRADEDPDGLRAEYEQTLHGIEEGLNRLRAAAARFDRSLDVMARCCLESRRRELAGPAAIAATLGLAVRRPEARPAEEPADARPAEEARIERECEEALQIMRNMARVMELDPAAFARMGEEELRSHFLVQLNGRFGGRATGETFNFRGKT
ncbi:MAG TPA: hypothetical protein VG672_03200, partial [Bryobacteraceae bacterium]|nr:hypothetical protein [Bryobacteraceae bacterium]